MLSFGTAKATTLRGIAVRVSRNFVFVQRLLGLVLKVDHTTP